MDNMGNDDDDFDYPKPKGTFKKYMIGIAFFFFAVGAVFCPNLWLKLLFIGGLIIMFLIA